MSVSVVEVYSMAFYKLFNNMVEKNLNELVCSINFWLVARDPINCIELYSNSLENAHFMSQVEINFHISWHFFVFVFFLQ